MDTARPTRRQLWAGLGVFCMGLAPLLAFKFQRGLVPGDLDIYRRAGSLFLHGIGPYGSGFTNGLRVKLPFTYPPFAALAVIPLAVLPGHLALVAWTLVNLALIGAATWWLFRPALERLRPRLGPNAAHPAVLGALAAALAWTLPAGQTIAYGQVNIVLAAACLFDCTRTGRRRGVLTGLATAVKLTPGLFIAYFAVTRQWAAAARAAATAVIAELVAAIVVPGATRTYFTHLVFKPRRIGPPAAYFNQSLYGEILRLHLPKELWAPAAAAVALLGLWQASRAYRAGASAVAATIVGLTAVLVSPISWQHHGVWIIPMLAVLLAWASGAGRTRRLAILALALAAFLAPVPQIGDILLHAGLLGPLARLLQSSDVAIYLVAVAFLPHVAVTRAERDAGVGPVDPHPAQAPSSTAPARA